MTHIFCFWSDSMLELCSSVLKRKSSIMVDPLYSSIVESLCKKGNREGEAWYCLNTTTTVHIFRWSPLEGIHCVALSCSIKRARNDRVKNFKITRELERVVQTLAPFYFCTAGQSRRVVGVNVRLTVWEITNRKLPDIGSISYLTIWQAALTEHT